LKTDAGLWRDCSHHPSREVDPEFEHSCGADHSSFQAGEVANAFAEEERLKAMQLINRQAQKKDTSIKELRDLFNTYDSDGSGEIGFAEFALMAEELGII